MNDLRIIFMGTPEFAVPSLEILIENKFNIVAVITAPDKPQGRGQKLTASPVKECALKNNIPILQPTNLKLPEFLEELKSYKANLQVVVAFRMLPEVVWAMPALGTFNLHASLLPQYRGAAPINWAIINGEKETGVTTFFLKHEIDTGSVIFQEKVTIERTFTATILHDRLKERGADLVVKTARAIAEGNFSSTPQKKIDNPKHAPKIFKEMCEINWNQPSETVRNFIRGLSSSPGAWTRINGKYFKILYAEIADGNRELASGSIETDQKTFLKVKTEDGWLNVERFQPEGKKRMTVEEYFRGNKI